MKVYCQHYGEKIGCLGEPDDQYIMRFDEIGGPPIHWCSFCGPDAHKINEALEEALEDPETRNNFAKMVREAEESRRIM